MAIYIGLELVDKNGSAHTYSFLSSDGKVYGTLMVDVDAKEVCLLESIDEHAEQFAYPRARRAIEKAMEKGALPDNLAYTA